MIGDNASQRLKSLVDRIERIESEIKDMNTDKSEIYKEAKFAGFDVKVLREVIKRRRMDTNDLNERESLVETYFAALGTPVATRARTNHDTTEHPSAVLSAGERGASAKSPDEVLPQTDGHSDTANSGNPPQSLQKPLPIPPLSALRGLGMGSSPPPDGNDVLGDDPLGPFKRTA